MRRLGREQRGQVQPEQTGTASLKQMTPRNAVAGSLMASQNPEHESTLLSLRPIVTSKLSVYWFARIGEDRWA
jgi:hypothetical protein